MTIDGSQNVGIGTASPSSRLDISGTTLIKHTYTGSANPIQFGQYDSSGNASINNQANAVLVLGTNNAERARISSAGYFSIGTTTTVGSGSAQLSVEGAGGVVCGIKSTGGSTQECVFNWNNATSGNNLFNSFYTETTATSRGSITYNRGAGLVAYNVTSDYRAKNIIGPVENSGALIDSVPVYMGKMKGATQERPMFIAHETPEYAHTGEKDAVDADGNPVYQQMDTSALVPVMWAEIQSLRQRLAALENK
jgi:hypothetical protein